MKNKKNLLLPMVALLLGVTLLGACSTKKKQEMNQKESELPSSIYVGMPVETGDNNTSGQVVPDRIGAGRPIAAAQAPIVIYKTRGDYRELVPIQLSADGSTV
ncbi:MAG: hypothetical protein ACFNJO_03920, partial [Porphyromonas endodontalis]